MNKKHNSYYIDKHTAYRWNNILVGINDASSKMSADAYEMDTFEYAHFKSQ